MTQRIAAVVFALVLGAFASVAQVPAGELEKKVDAVFAAYDKPDSPGCALGVIRDGKLIYARGYGSANLEHNLPLTPQSILDIGSTSKQFTAAGIVLLQQQGKLTLEDDVRKYIPELPDYGKKITIRHLLNHTSGLRDYLTLFSLAGIDFDGVTGEAEALAFIVRQKELNFDPGSEYLYSNSGFFLLGVIVKRTSGKSLREYAQEHIFAPLGMKATHFHDSHTEIVPKRATGYGPRREGGFQMDMSNFEQTGDGAVMTSVEDLLLWDQNFYNPKVGGEGLWRELLTRGVLNSGEKIDYALGIVPETYKGLEAISHGGSWAGYRAQFMRFPTERFSVICLCNLANTNPTGLARQVADVYLADKLKAPAPPADAKAEPAPAIHIPDEVLKGYAGLYRNPVTGAMRRLEFSDGKLRARRSANPNAPLDELIPSGAARFRIAGAPVRVEIVMETAAAGGRPQVILNREGSKPERFEPVEASSPTEAQLAEFAGTYGSDELDVVYTLSVKEGRLALRTRYAPERAARPVYRDAFLADGGAQFEFQRDAQRRITGFTVQAGRVRNIAFRRM
jgi:CubicO group peptidase (beta-lactamase class C family)